MTTLLLGALAHGSHGHSLDRPEVHTIMLTKLFLLAQKATPPSSNAEPVAGGESAFFNLRNLILVAAIIIILVAYKVYKDKAMK